MGRHNSVNKLEYFHQDDDFSSYGNSAARLEAVLNSQPDCVKIISRDYKLITINAAGIKLVNAGNIDEVRGASMLDIVDLEYHNVFKQSVDAAYAGQPMNSEYNITCFDGIKRRMSQHSAPIFSTENPSEVIEVVAVSRDVTMEHEIFVSLAEAKRMAEEASKVKSNFLATMSHEFRTPLNAILGFSEIIKSESFGKIGNAKYAEYIEDIYNSGRHLLDLINDVLDISEIEAEKRTILKEEINLEETVLHCLSAINILAEKKQIMIKVNIAGNISTLFADIRSVKQILINLLSNAVKFSLQGGVVILNVSENFENVNISIIDNGIGTSKESLGNITQPFYRGQSDAEHSAPGTGLGLSIVKSLLDAHNGSIDIKSTEHVGTTVNITLPLHHGEV
ncbi:MAG: hypothetical protein JKY84_04590 [Emcibacteraceae bacterium]|nr:hypothetical protein [Emcibacteraceae bacterium]